MKNIPCLVLTLFGSPCLHHENGDAPPSDPVLLPRKNAAHLLALLAASGGEMPRAAVVAVRREMLGDDGGDNIAKNVRVIEGRLRVELRQWIGLPPADSGETDYTYLDKAPKSVLRLHPANVSSDVQTYRRLVSDARAFAEKPEKWREYRAALDSAHRLYQTGELLPGYEHKWTGLFSETLSVGGKPLCWIERTRVALADHHRWVSERRTALDRSPWGNLPYPRDVFIGREADAAPVRDFLRGVGKHGTLPALQVFGGGGVGKTRLAVDTVRGLGEREISARFPGGVTFLPLDESYTDDNAEAVSVEAVYRTFAAALAAPDPVARAPATFPNNALAVWLVASQRRLLILDNYESVYNARVNAFLEAFVSAAQDRLRVVVTTRACVSGLPHVAVAGLPVPAFGKWTL